MEEYGFMPGRYPAIVKSYDKTKRTCRIELPGLTDGGDVLPEAEIEYPIGDKSKSGAHATELEIVSGDTVWVAFIGGDPRYPIITGYRNPQAGNSADWRRFHHENMELLADKLMKLIAGGDFLIQAGGKFTADAKGAVDVISGADATVKSKGKTSVDAKNIDLNGGGNLCPCLNTESPCVVTGMGHPSGSSTVKVSS